MTGRFLPTLPSCGKAGRMIWNNIADRPVTPFETQILKQRGTDPCLSSNRLFSSLSSAAASRPAATPPASRRFMAAARVRPLPRPRRTTRSRAPSSVPARTLQRASSATSHVNDTALPARPPRMKRVAGPWGRGPARRSSAPFPDQTRFRPPCASHRAAFSRFSAPGPAPSCAPIRVAAGPDGQPRANRPSKPKDVPCSTRS